MRETVTAHLAALQNFVRREVEDVHDQLRHGLAADPQEHVESVFDEEEPVPLSTLR